MTISSRTTTMTTSRLGTGMMPIGKNEWIWTRTIVVPDPVQDHPIEQILLTRLSTLRTQTPTVTEPKEKTGQHPKTTRTRGMVLVNHGLGLDGIRIRRLSKGREGLKKRLRMICYLLLLGDLRLVYSIYRLLCCLASGGFWRRGRRL